MRPIIVEGPDGSGKSTLLDALSLDLDLIPYHSGGPPQSREEFFARIRKFEEVKAEAIYDRCPHISEYIYGAINGRKPVATWDELLLLLRKLNPVIVYCRRDDIEDMWNSISQHQKPHKPATHLRDVMKNYAAIVDKYDEVMSSRVLGLPVIRYDWGSTYYKSVLSEILRCAVSS